MNNLLFGSDPETFASYSEGGKDYVVPPAYFRMFLGLPFTPDEEGRHPKFIVQDGITIHEDGAAFEFTLPPAQSISELLKGIHKGYDLLQEKILSHYDYTLKISPSINYEVKRWQEYYHNTDFLQTIMFGCDPHNLAWNVEQEDVPIDASQHKYRYGGGHIHVSGMEIFKENPILCARVFDMTVGLAATAFSPVPELEKIRTFRYGKPGVWRPQQYPNGSFGMEYRSVSNSWTDPNNKNLAEEIERWMMIAINKFLSDPDRSEELVLDWRELMTKAITTSNQTLAKRLLHIVEGA